LKKQLSSEQVISYLDTFGNQTKAAKFLGSGISTIREWRAAKRIPPKILKKFEQQQDEYDSLSELLVLIREMRQDADHLNEKLDNAEKKVEAMLAKLLVVK
jgi:ATP-dependent Lon protease